jgi:uncharacterized membrane protein
LTLAAFLMAVATIHLDQVWGSAWLTSFEWFEGVRPAGARAQLTVIASAMIAVSSTLFAITIAAVAFASGNYGPRLLTNFMSDRGNQVSLGVFIATFAYNLMVLRVVRDSEGAPAPGEAAEAMSAFVPQLSMLVSSASAILAIGVLVYFLHHIPASIRINTVLAGIGRHLLKDIEDRFPEDRSQDESAPGEEEGAPVTAGDEGYIEIIDFRSLGKIAAQADATISLCVRTGDFVHPVMPLLQWAGEPPSDELAERLRNCFSLGASRTPSQDLEFLIDEMVEIALRALSPGVNDPFTAVTSLHWMGAAIGSLARRSLRNGPEQDKYQAERVRTRPDDFGHFLKRSFGGVRASVAASPIASKIFLDTLEKAALGQVSPKRRALILEEGRLLVVQAEGALHGPALEELKERLATFEASIGRMAS